MTSDVLTALRWSVDKAKSLDLAPGVTLRMIEMRESPSFLALQLYRSGEGSIESRTMIRALAKAHVETRGKSMWFRDNTWRLSPAGVEFFTPGIDAVLAKIGAGS